MVKRWPWSLWTSCSALGYLFGVLTGQMAIREHGNAQYCTHVLIDPFRENDTLIFKWIPWPSHWKTWWNFNDVIIFCRDHEDHGSYHDKLWCFVDGSKAAFTPEAKFSSILVRTLWFWCFFRGTQKGLKNTCFFAQILRNFCASWTLSNVIWT